MATNYYVIIDGIGENNSGHTLEEVRVDGSLDLSGLLNGESKVLAFAKRPGYFTHMMYRYWFSGARIPKIRIIQKNEIYPSSYQDIEDIENIPENGTNPYTLLNCQVTRIEEPNNGFFVNVIYFEYTTLVKNTPQLTKPTLRHEKPHLGVYHKTIKIYK